MTDILPNGINRSQGYGGGKMIENQGPNWLQIVITSAVVSSLLNIAWNFASKWWDVRKEDQEREVNRRLALHEVSMRLSGFAKECSTHIDQISEALYIRAAHHDESALHRLKPPEFHPIDGVDWTLFDIATVDALKTMKNRFGACNDWIVENWQNGADTEETYDLETQRCVVFGREALDLAIRMRINATLQRGEHSELGNFEHHMNRFRERYRSSKNSTLLPQLEDMLALEPTLSASRKG